GDRDSGLARSARRAQTDSAAAVGVGGGIGARDLEHGGALVGGCLGGAQCCHTTRQRFDSIERFGVGAARALVRRMCLLAARALGVDAPRFGTYPTVKRG